MYKRQGLRNTRAYARRGFAIRRLLQDVGGQGRDFDLQVDAVEQWAGEPATITQHLIRRTPASAARIAVIAARTGVHRRDELELGRKLGLARGARYVNAPRVQRLAQCFQYAAVELGDLVEEKNTLMGEMCIRDRRWGVICQGAGLC